MRPWLVSILFIPFCLYSGSDNNANMVTVRDRPTSRIDPCMMIHEGQKLLREGDLVVRLNQDPVSRFIKNLNRHDKSYSHAGIVLFENGHPYVFHMLNDEENPDGNLKKDPFELFCDPRKNTAFGIFRYDLKDHEQKRLKHLIESWYAKGLKFDMAFNLLTDDRMYCSEMVSKSLAAVTNKRIVIATTPLSDEEARLFSRHIRIPFAYASQLRVVAIDALYKNPFCQAMKEFNYKTGRLAATEIVANYQ